MDKEMEFVCGQLINIDQKHADYLHANAITIMQIVHINWEKPFSAHSVGQIPFDLASDIEEMFWVE